jgi:tetratricopeptide (TPR) repeat protein
MRLHRFTTVALLLSSLALAQSAAPKPKPAPARDYSGEAFVVERVRQNVRFEDDGTSRRTVAFQVRVKTEAGVQAWGLLRFGYDSATQRILLDDISVHKADGTVVRADTSSIQDLASPIQNEAPVYTDFREKHVTVPALKPGDLLYDTVTYELQTPIAPGQFWFEYSFDDKMVTLDEELIIDVPAARPLKIKWPKDHAPQVTEANGRRLYLWKRSQLEPTKLNQPYAEVSAEDVQPDIQLTTFQDWGQFSDWYAGLVKERAVATPEVQKAAADVVAGLTTEQQKIEAIYGYVAKSIRYISLSFGVGRLQPHSAADVLRNQYGDCKDKHTLLAAMLSTIGVAADPVLIHVLREVDPEIPSPAPFNHLITAVRRNTGETLWLDATTEVAPPAYLLLPLRDKQALLVQANGAGRLVTTPAATPRSREERFTVEGSLDASGTLSAVVTLLAGVDDEVPLRTVFRKVPRARWEEVIKKISEAWGLGGTVSDVQVTDPLDTTQPFKMSYKVRVPLFAKRSGKEWQLKSPFPAHNLKVAADPSTRKDVIHLSKYVPSIAIASIRLPEDTTARLPVSIDLKRDWAEYHSHYKLEGSTIRFERSFKVLAKELARNRFTDYNALSRTIDDDEEQRVALTLSDRLNTVVKGDEGEDAGSEDADELYDAANSAFRSGNVSRAFALLEDLVEKEPKHRRAWLLLGQVRRAQGDDDGALAAFQKQVEIDPYAEGGPNAELSGAFYRAGRYADAEAALRRQLEISPLSWSLYFRLGWALIQQKKYREAIEPLERAFDHGMAEARQPLIQAYIGSGDDKTAIVKIEQWLKERPAASTYNEAAIVLADEGVELERAERYARSALAQAYADTVNHPSDSPGAADLRSSWFVGAYWDTLGWVLLQKGDLAGADRYLQAAFWVVQEPDVPKHLAKMYEKLGQPEKAKRAWALAYHAASGPQQYQRGEFKPDLLRAVGGGEKAMTSYLEKTRLDLQELRSVHIKAAKKASGIAEFYIVFGRGAAPQSAEFVTGDEDLRPLADSLLKADYKVVFPDDAQVRIVRHGMLSCTASLPNCELVFVPVANQFFYPQPEPGDDDK